MSKEAVERAIDALCDVDLTDGEKADLAAALFERLLARGAPQPAFGALQDEARYWAANVSSIEGEAYLAAICDTFSRDKAMAEAQRKRLMLAMWEGLPEAWRAAFIARVTHG